MKPVRFLPAAEAELLHETAYYSAARKGFGLRFKDAVKAIVDRAARAPQSGAPGIAGTRKFRVVGFPFNVFYREGEHEVLVVAIAPDSRRAGYWSSRAE